jgi:hypothetical protein
MPDFQNADVVGGIEIEKLFPDGVAVIVMGGLSFDLRSMASDHDVAG